MGTQGPCVVFAKCMMLVADVLNRQGKSVACHACMQYPGHKVVGVALHVLSSSLSWKHDVINVTDPS